MLPGDGLMFRAGPAPMIELIRRADQIGEAVEGRQPARRKITRIPLHFYGSAAAGEPIGLESLPESSAMTARTGARR